MAKRIGRARPETLRTAEPNSAEESLVSVKHDHVSQVTKLVDNLGGRVEMDEDAVVGIVLSDTETKDEHLKVFALHERGRCPPRQAAQSGELDAGRNPLQMPNCRFMAAYEKQITAAVRGFLTLPDTASPDDGILMEDAVVVYRHLGVLAPGFALFVFTFIIVILDFVGLIPTRLASEFKVVSVAILVLLGTATVLYEVEV